MPELFMPELLIKEIWCIPLETLVCDGVRRVLGLRREPVVSVKDPTAHTDPNIPLKKRTPNL